MSFSGPSRCWEDSFFITDSLRAALSCLVVYRRGERATDDMNTTILVQRPLMGNGIDVALGGRVIEAADLDRRLHALERQQGRFLPGGIGDQAAE